MKMKTRLATLLVVLATSSPLFSATELERLRAQCEEQKLQIHQLEVKIAQLTDTPPPPSRSAATAPSVARDFEPVSEESTYTVKSGDIIERIASKQGVSVSSLTKLNGLHRDSIIHPGQKLKIPGKTSVAKNETAATPAKETETYTIQSGDTYYRISTKFGVSVDDLISANPNVNHKALRIGQKIKINRPQKNITKSASPTPAPSLASGPSIPVSNIKSPAEKPRISDRPIRIEKEITYGQFAKQYNTTTQRLDELNGLELDSSTVLAQGSELYIPAQP